MSKRVYKYATGQDVPEGAVYLSTVTELLMVQEVNEEASTVTTRTKNELVWHYFLVEVK